MGAVAPYLDPDLLNSPTAPPPFLTEVPTNALPSFSLIGGLAGGLDICREGCNGKQEPPPPPRKKS